MTFTYHDDTVRNIFIRPDLRSGDGGGTLLRLITAYNRELYENQRLSMKRT